MAERRQKLTTENVKALKPSPDGRAYHVFDTELSGYYAIVQVSGVKSFGVRFRAGRQRKRIGLGKWGTVTADEARRKARELLSQAALGGDPAAEREAKREGLTFAEMRKSYVESAAKRLKSVRDPKRYLAMAGQEWDGRLLAEVTTRDVEVLRDRLAERGVVQANRFLAAVRAALAHAVRLGHVDKNVAATVPLLAESTGRTRVLSAEEEMRLRSAVEEEGDFAVRAAFFLILDAGARGSEVLHARWADFAGLDGEQAVWTIPSPKAGRAQGVPLLATTASAVAAAMKKAAEAPVASPYLLSGDSPLRPRASLRGPWERLKEKAKLGDDIRLHDLRRTAGLRWTRAAGITAAQRLLRHSSPVVTARVYSPLAPEDLRGWAEQAAPVVKLKGRRKRAKK